MRYVHAALYYTIFSRLPRSSSPGGRIWAHLRASTCRRLFASCGTDVNIERLAVFGSGARISLGHRSGIGLRAQLVGPVEIGTDVMMGPDVLIMTQNHEIRNTDVPMHRQGLCSPEPVVIESDVWIGARAIILPGVRIGRGAVVAAGAIVTRDVEPFCVVGGSPARVLRRRK